MMASAGEEKRTPRETIMVIGTATVKSAPNEAVLNLSVEADGVEPGLAANADSAAVRGVIDRLAAEGVEDADIETANVSVHPVRTYDPRTGEENLSGYRAQNTITVTLRDAQMVGKVLAAGVDAGVTSVSGPIWRLTDDGAAVAEALARAVANARAKAEVLARANGVEVGRVLAIREGGVERPVITARAEMYEMAKARSGAAMDAFPISAATLEVRAAVTVTYALNKGPANGE